MINFDDYSNENKTVKELHSHNLKWPYIPDHPYRLLIIGGLGSGKTNALLNFRNNKQDIDKMSLYAIVCPPPPLSLGGGGGGLILQPNFQKGGGA